jgi:amino acid transporter
MPFQKTKSKSRKINNEMLETYYKIWASLFIKIKDAQSGNHNLSLILSLIVISATNIMNFLFIAMLLILFVGFDIYIFNKIPLNRSLQNIIIVLCFFLANYFLLVHNNKHKDLLKKYQDRINMNLGFRYFILSCAAILVLVFSTILFPDFFGLKSVN